MNGSAASRATAILLRALREAVVTVLATAGAAAASQWAQSGAASAVLGAVLALSLARSHLAAERRGWLEALALLPVVSLAAMGVGLLLREWPWPGAAVFTAVVAASSWIRRFGPLAQRLGRLVTLPFVTLLVVPPLPRPAGPLAPVMALVAPVAIALMALACVLVAQRVGRLLGWLPATTPAAAPAPPASAPGTLRPSAPVRLALQMGVALAVAFAVGLLAFPTHWRWLVLTALLVNTGSIGRFDVVRRGALRVGGAAGGTVLAMAIAGHAAGGAGTVAALILACVFVGVFLRPLGYGWWVLCITLALALLQQLQPAAAPLLLWQRLGEIAIGAVISIAAAALVFPIPSLDILRKRVAGALAAMSDALDPQAAERHPETIAGAMILVRQMRPVFRAHRLARPSSVARPADWIDTLLACEAPVLALVERGQAPGAVRKAVGAARKAMREPVEIGPALGMLREALEAAGRHREDSPAA